MLGGGTWDWGPASRWNSYIARYNNYELQQHEYLRVSSYTFILLTARFCGFQVVAHLLSLFKHSANENPRPVPTLLYNASSNPQNSVPRLVSAMSTKVPRIVYALGFLATIKYIGVNSFCLPPATRASAATAKLSAVFAVPRGAMRSVSSAPTNLCIIDRPM